MVSVGAVALSASTLQGCGKGHSSSQSKGPNTMLHNRKYKDNKTTYPKKARYEAIESMKKWMKKRSWKNSKTVLDEIYNAADKAEPKEAAYYRMNFKGAEDKYISKYTPSKEQWKNFMAQAIVELHNKLDNKYDDDNKRVEAKGLSDFLTKEKENVERTINEITDALWSEKEEARWDSVGEMEALWELLNAAQLEAAELV